MSTTYVRFPRVSEVLHLVANPRFRAVVEEIVSGPDQSPTHFGVLSMADEFAYLRLRFLAGVSLKDIRHMMGMSSYRFFWLRVAAHYLVYERLAPTMPALAATFGYEAVEDFGDGAQTDSAA